MQYKGYTGKAESDEEAGILHGEVMNTRDVITFQGKSVTELKKAFQASVDDYLAFCAERGEEPDKPFPEDANLAVRIDVKTTTGGGSRLPANGDHREGSA